jgi:hypothetical protein
VRPNERERAHSRIHAPVTGFGRFVDMTPSRPNWPRVPQPHVYITPLLRSGGLRTTATECHGPQDTCRTGTPRRSSIGVGRPLSHTAGVIRHSSQAGAGSFSAASCIPRAFCKRYRYARCTHLSSASPCPSRPPSPQPQEYTWFSSRTRASVWFAEQAIC